MLLFTFDYDYLINYDFISGIIDIDIYKNYEKEINI